MSLQFPRSCYSGDFPTVGGAVATSTGNACATANPTIAHEGQQYRRSSHGPHPGPRRQASGGSSRAARCGCQCITATRSNEPWSVPSMPAALNSAREEQLQSVVLVGGVQDCAVLLRHSLTFADSHGPYPGPCRQASGGAASICTTCPRNIDPCARPEEKDGDSARAVVRSLHL